MPKQKTRSSAKKRFKKVGDGKLIKRAKAYHRHLLTKKSGKTKRQLRKGAYVSSSDVRRILTLLPY